nr:hypothetical protein [Tanacetum cinerariifolium]
MQTQTSNTLYNAIMEAGGKDRPPVLAPGNYIQWKSRIKRYIDAKPNHELIHYCLQNPPYEYKWNDKDVPVAKGSTETTTERYIENYKNISQDIRDQLNVKAEAVQIILTGIDNDIYSTVTHLQAQNDLFRAENDKIKQHYKELYDSIKITRAKQIEQESVETIRDIVEEAKVVRPLDRYIVSACCYTKYSQELLEYAIGTCPHGSQPRAKQLAHILLIRKKQVSVAQPSDKGDSTTHPHVVTVTSQKINAPVPPSTGVDCCPIARGSQPMSHVKPNRISPAKGDTKLPIGDKPRKTST